MEIMFMLVIQGISCVLSGGGLSDVVFWSCASLIWLLLFKYVFIKIQEKNGGVVWRRRNTLYLSIICVASILSQVVCILLVFAYPLYLLNSVFKFASVGRVEGVSESLRMTTHDCGASRLNNDNMVTTMSSGVSSFTSGGLSSNQPCSLNSSHTISDIANVQTEVCNESGAVSGSISELNPASGLAMIGNVDVAGNPYGIDRNY